MDADRYIEECIRSGNKLKAVKIYRENYPCSLAEAKKAVEDKERLIAARGKWQNGGAERIQQWRKENHYNNEELPTRGKRCVISSIDGMEGHQFEFFCADLLRKVGFGNVSVTPGSGDQGVDILAEKDGVRYAVQCKNYSTPLGNTPVQEVNAGKTFYNCHVGVVMTNSTFTRGAESLASATGVLLWDRAHLERLMEKAGVQLVYDDGEEEIDFDDIDDEIEEDFDEAVEEGEGYIVTANIKKTRIGMQFFSTICFAWSIVCFLLVAGGLVAGDQELRMIGLSEGAFMLVIGSMFRVLAKSEKRDPYVHLRGKNIRKSVFAIICVGAAFALFSIVVGIMGGFN